MVDAAAVGLGLVGAEQRSTGAENSGGAGDLVDLVTTVVVVTISVCGLWNVTTIVGQLSVHLLEVPLGRLHQLSYLNSKSMQHQCYSNFDVVDASSRCDGGG